MDKVRASSLAKKSREEQLLISNHNSATSNIVERLFSRAELVMTAQRR